MQPLSSANLHLHLVQWSKVIDDIPCAPLPAWQIWQVGKSVCSWSWTVRFKAHAWSVRASALVNTAKRFKPGAELVLRHWLEALTSLLY